MCIVDEIFTGTFSYEIHHKSRKNCGGPYYHVYDNV